MAYVKYKELTKYFNFSKEIEADKLPKYVTDYTEANETIYKAYKTLRDKALFTNKRMVLFDVDPIFNTKKIHIIPYHSISTGAICFKRNTGSIFLSFDSGYQLMLKFIKMNADDKTELRKLYSMIMNYVTKDEK